MFSVTKKLGLSSCRFKEIPFKYIERRVSIQYSTKSLRYVSSDLLPETWVLRTGHVESDQQALNIASKLKLPVVEKVIKPTLGKFGPGISGRPNLFYSQLPIPTLYETGRGLGSSSPQNSTTQLISQNKKDKYRNGVFFYLSNGTHPESCSITKEDVLKLEKDIMDIFNVYKFRLNIFIPNSTNDHVRQLSLLGTAANPSHVKVFEEPQSVDKAKKESHSESSEIYKSFIESSNLVITTADSLVTVSTGIFLKKPVYIINQESTSKLLRQFYQRTNLQGLTKRFYLESSSSYQYMIDSNTKDYDEFSITSISNSSDSAEFFDLRSDVASTKNFADFMIKKFNESA
ncbi:hypothetical protein BB560_003873 [Smittium megazygosporum]|uniref:Uncharacterized protein n=1 Tax=Smittium megazygosporum TaxID=133381 RepID=A0A2T9Z762_9FUNG|nr:hypothetical protein BB560_005191 [Smittium megazygosporum]PVV01697.1 hypothetical protein BB560_003873 [Smittium megazygosporum]